MLSLREDARASDGLPLSARSGLNRPMLFGGLLLALLGALIFGVAWINHVGGGVLVVARPVAAGAIITDQDVSVSHMTLDGSGDVVPEEQRSSVVGHTASVPLLPGELLSHRQVGRAEITTGTATVGVALKPGQFPPSLAAGDHVVVVGGAPQSSDGGATDTVLSTATVLDVQAPDSGSQSVATDTIVSLQLDGASAAKVAAAAASGTVTLVLVPDATSTP